MASNCLSMRNPSPAMMLRGAIFERFNISSTQIGLAKMILDHKFGHSRAIAPMTADGGNRADP
jgi:hypothetical protein